MTHCSANVIMAQTSYASGAELHTAADDEERFMYQYIVATKIYGSYIRTSYIKINK